MPSHPLFLHPEVHPNRDESRIIINSWHLALSFPILALNLGGHPEPAQKSSLQNNQPSPVCFV
jgi:hypothetical protein